MAFHDLLVSEIFYSLQGETSLSGVPFGFVRLTGCNLRCNYCDSTYAFKGGQRMSITEIQEKLRAYRVKNILLTGGEPLLQRQTPLLAKILTHEGYQVSIETHGEVSIEPVVQFSRIIMDIKTPSSGMCRGGYIKNLPLLKPKDEIKFVITSPDDYEWAKRIVLEKNLPTQEILFSSAMPAKNSPGRSDQNHLSGGPTWLAERILEDQLPVRFQLQIHKYLWGADQRGV